MYTNIYLLILHTFNIVLIIMTFCIIIKLNVHKLYKGKYFMNLSISKKIIIVIIVIGLCYQFSTFASDKITNSTQQGVFLPSRLLLIMPLAYTIHLTYVEFNTGTTSYSFTSASRWTSASLEWNYPESVTLACSSELKYYTDSSLVHTVTMYRDTGSYIVTPGTINSNYRNNNSISVPKGTDLDGKTCAVVFCNSATISSKTHWFSQDLY